MNLQTIAEHTVDIDLLPDKANILDAGCRGFEFANFFILNGHNVITIDADPDVISTSNKHVNGCLVEFDNGASPFKIENDKQASHVAVGCFTGLWIKNYNLKSLSKNFNINHWDLIKMDIEGSEKEVIMGMDQPIAKQISVEMHAHCSYDLQTIEMLVNKLISLDYQIAQHTIERRHGLGLNAWDSLFILK